jgi:hypothetical protein
VTNLHGRNSLHAKICSDRKKIDEIWIERTIRIFDDVWNELRYWDMIIDY